MYKLTIPKLLGFLKANLSRIIIVSFFLLIVLIIPLVMWFAAKDFLTTTEGAVIVTIVATVITVVALLITIVTEWDKIVSFYQHHWGKNDCPSGQICALTKAELETPEGRMRLDSPFYVERPPIETDCYAEILKPCALIRIKAPRQMGKTSLLSRILEHARQHEGARTVDLSFQEVEEACLENLETYLKWFCSITAQHLGIDPQIEEHWLNDFSHKTNATDYFEKYLLPQLTTPLVLGLDEVDRLFSYEKVANDVLSQWRNWHEKGKDNALWAQVRLIIVHSQEVYVSLNMNESPFNVGKNIQLPEFTLTQVQDLSRRHGLASWSEEDSKRLMQMVGGHPFLVRQAFYQIASGNLTLDQLLNTAPTEEGIYHEHLYHHWLNLRDGGLDQVMKQVVHSTNAMFIDSKQAFKLRSMGLVKSQEDNVVPAFDLYRWYFQKRL